jgi:hypothetical protein
MIVRSEYFIGIKHLLKGRAVTQVRSASWVVNGTLWPWANHLTSLGFMFLFFCCFFIFIYLLIYFLWYWELNSWPMFARQVLYPLSHAFLFFFHFLVVLGVWAHGLALAWQKLYHLSHIPRPQTPSHLLNGHEVQGGEFEFWLGKNWKYFLHKECFVVISHNLEGNLWCVTLCVCVCVCMFVYVCFEGGK